MGSVRNKIEHSAELAVTYFIITIFLGTIFTSRVLFYYSGGDLGVFIMSPGFFASYMLQFVLHCFGYFVYLRHFSKQLFFVG